MNIDESEIQQVVIEQKIMKVNGEVAYKRYRLGKILGRGGFAKCYEGVNIETNKHYAVKLIEKATLQKNRAKQKLLSEIKIHKTLHHEHIVEFDSVFQDSTNVYIVLQLCTCKTLSEMVKKRKRLTTKQVRYFLIQLLNSVQYMHSNRIIHRDLKLGNIFLDNNIRIKVGDFGLATKLEFANEKKRTMCGTPNYIAPEIVEGSIGHSYQVDIWSIGVICYAFLFGRPPFETSQIKMTYKRIKICEYSFPNINVEQQAKDFIRKILVLDPKTRLTIKQMRNHDFLQNENIPYQLPIESLTTIPTFKSNTANKNGSILPFDQIDGLEKISKTGKFLIAQNNVKLAQGLLSPRNAFNDDGKNQNQLNSDHEQHQVKIIAHVDYSKKYGLGYVINNSLYGVYFNDQTLMSTDSNKQKVYFIENPTAKTEKVQLYATDQIPKNRDFQKKYLLLERFITHLKEQLIKQASDDKFFVKFHKFIYMKQWLKTRHAIMFGLSNKMFQVNFFDHSQILLHLQKKSIKFTSKKGGVIYESLANVLQSQQTEMSRRIKYTKEILNSIKKKKNQKIQDIQLKTD